MGIDVVLQIPTASSSMMLREQARNCQSGVSHARPLPTSALPLLASWTAQGLQTAT